MYDLLITWPPHDSRYCATYGLLIMHVLLSVLSIVTILVMYDHLYMCVVHGLAASCKIN
jgi:hypothetical protein